jgi:hypothetical protein
VFSIDYLPIFAVIHERLRRTGSGGCRRRKIEALVVAHEAGRL